jgi:hypothetical protein
VSNTSPIQRSSAPLIVVRDFRTLDLKGKQFPDKKGHFKYKVRRLIEGAVTEVTDRRGTVIDEITMVGGYYDDHPDGSLHDTHEEAVAEMQKLAAAKPKK